MVEYEISDHALEGWWPIPFPSFRGCGSWKPLPAPWGGFPPHEAHQGGARPRGLTVDLVLSVDYGVSIPEAAQAVQKAVAEALFVATGEKVRAVNLTVAQVEYRKEAHA